MSDRTTLLVPAQAMVRYRISLVKFYPLRSEMPSIAQPFHKMIIASP